MNDASATKTTSIPSSKEAVGRLFVLELSGNRIHAMNPDGSDRKVIVADCHLPDGIVVDVEAGHIYWTNMGVPSLDDGSIERADLDGSNRRVIVPQGITHTPKQLHLEKRSGKLYWCDREGMRVMRANLNGTKVETLVQTGEGEDDSRDATKWCVGITVDPVRGQVYWTQKGPDNAGLGCIFRTAKTPRVERISKHGSTTCRSRSTSSSTSKAAFSIGRIAAIRRPAIRSIVPRSMRRPEMATHLSSSSAI
jgi:hypothetical protein